FQESLEETPQIYVADRMSSWWDSGERKSEGAGEILVGVAGMAVILGVAVANILVTAGILSIPLFIAYKLVKWMDGENPKPS
ncbi:hypothetical protein M3M33_16090, partial [Loigolactobacillus coryniformis]|uniref:hypothetical protein n=1 Tax=Loigolactobacillus coryniformis TaxID=1610 RepID=UPI00201A46F8